MEHDNESMDETTISAFPVIAGTNEKAPRVRLATDEDADAILNIYAPFIADTFVTFETVVPTTSAFAARVAEIRTSCPYLVIERDGRVSGYAYAHPSGDRAAYAWNAELSVYLSPAEQKHGTAFVLCRALEELLCAQGYKNLLSRVTSPNIGSEKLHAKLGFNVLGIQKNAGYKAGAWHDVQHFQKAIAPCAPNPGAVTAFSELDPAFVADVVKRANEQLDAAWHR